MSNSTLGEFLAEASRGMGGGYTGRASGPLPGYMFGPDFFRKQTYLQISSTFNATYGKKVWDALNNRTVTFNAIKKVDWGPTVGWRLRTARGNTGNLDSTQTPATTWRSGPVTETGFLPTISNSSYAAVYGYPKSIASTFGVSLKGQAVSALEGGIGNQFAVEQEGASRDHIKEINYELMASSAYGITAGSATTATIGSGTTATGSNLAGSFRLGDTLASGTGTTGFAVTGINLTTGVITCSTGLSGTTSADAVFIRSRNGLTSIDDICMDDTALPGGCTVGHCLAAAYNLTSGRPLGSYASGAAPAGGYNAGVKRDLTLALIDSGIAQIRQNGGEPKLIIMGLDGYDKINQLLQTQQRFMDVSDYIVGVGDERTYPGTRAGFQLATYRGIPILPDPDTAKSISATPLLEGSNVYILDTDYLEIAVMYPTQYVENRDYFSANALVLRGLFVTMAEMRCLRPDCMYSIKDISP